MTCREIYGMAMALLGECAGSPGTEDYEARAPELLSIAAARWARLSEQLGTAVPRSALVIGSLDEAFPLDERLHHASAELLAAMLIFDELPELAVMLEERAERDSGTVADDALTLGSTREVYGL